MGLLSSLTTASDVQAVTDSVGGTYTVESDTYNVMIEMAYINLSKGGAIGLVLHLKTDAGVLKNTLWVQSGNAKGNNNFYLNKNGKKVYLPGFIHANDICQLTLGKDLSELENEEKVIKLWNSDARAEVPTKVPMLTDLLQQPVTLGIRKTIEDQNTQNASGDWIASGDTKESNEIDKVFRAADGLTKLEIDTGDTSPAFKEKWLTKNKGKTQNKAKGAPANATGNPSATAGPVKRNTPNLFA